MNATNELQFFIKHFLSMPAHPTMGGPEGYIYRLGDLQHWLEMFSRDDPEYLATGHNADMALDELNRLIEHFDCTVPICEFLED